ncbi:MAG TPA: hypothetical protein VHW47_04690 [Acidimicrobiales bacterium]|jgi:hypothetical protein|nr:hypothetical protein [Acidimicrobiales bacterium]
MAMAPPADAREWVSFEDPEEERTWVFDVSFLSSNWTCIFGRGCQGVLTGPAPELVHGCCSYGAHMVDKKDAHRVEKLAGTLSPEEWQFHARGTQKGVLKENKHGETVTRLVDGACIFLNRPGFPTGPGCALHQVALQRGQNPLELKPEVCWQLPLRREDEVAEDGYVTSTIRQWDRRHWGAGGQEFAWWCTESHEAFVGTVPVYVEMEAELTAMVGPRTYRLLVDYLQDRQERIPKGVPLPHPAVRRRDPAQGSPT